MSDLPLNGSCNGNSTPCPAEAGHPPKGGLILQHELNPLRQIELTVVI
jgi:hypothetical protein